MQKIIVQSHNTPHGQRVLNRLRRRARHGERIELCGRSGFRVYPIQGRFQQLCGAETALGRVVWHPDEMVNGRRSYKRKRYAGQPPSGSAAVLFDDGRAYFGTDGGVKRGRDVHNEVCDFVTMLDDRFHAAHPLVDPITKRVVCKLGKLGLLGIAAEFRVYDRDLGVGTAIDLLCLDAEGRLVAIELKTGYNDGVFVRPRSSNESRMRDVFAHVPDTVLNRARFQLALGVLLLERSYGVVVDRSYVIHAPSAKTVDPSYAIHAPSAKPVDLSYLIHAPIAPSAKIRVVCFPQLEEIRTSQPLLVNLLIGYRAARKVEVGARFF